MQIVNDNLQRKSICLDAFGQPTFEEINKIYEKLHNKGCFIGGGDIDDILRVLLEEGIVNGVYNKDES